MHSIVSQLVNEWHKQRSKDLTGAGDKMCEGGFVAKHVTYSRGADPRVRKASQKACNKIAKVKENDMKPITIDARLIGAMVTMFLEAQLGHGYVP